MLETGRHELKEKQEELINVNREMKACKTEHSKTLACLDTTSKELKAKHTQLEAFNRRLEKSKTEHTRTAADLRTARKELFAVRDELGATTRDLNDTRKEKESLEVCFTVITCMSVCEDSCTVVLCWTRYIIT